MPHPPAAAPLSRLSRLASTDRTFKLVAGAAGLVLVGFIAYVVVGGGTSGGARTAGDGPTFPDARPAMLAIGSTAPGFSLPRLDGGAPVTLSQLRGTPVILSFFASWCPHCREELAAVATVARREAGRVAVVGVDANDTSTTAARRLLAAAGAAYPVAIDAQGTLATRYRITALPVTYFLSRSGRVEGAAFGVASLSLLTRWARGMSAAPVSASTATARPGAGATS